MWVRPDVPAMLHPCLGLMQIVSDIDKQDGLYVTDDSKVADKMRGLLCANCNVGIGLLNDHKEGLQKTLDYLRNTQ